MVVGLGSCHHAVPRSKLSPMHCRASKNKAGCGMLSQYQPFSQHLPLPPSLSPTSAVVTGPAKGKGRPCSLLGPLAARLAMVLSPGHTVPGKVAEGSRCGGHRATSMGVLTQKGHGGRGEGGPEMRSI